MVVSSGIRPFEYTGLNPFRLGTSEKVGFSGILFSESAFAALADFRLFRAAGATPTPIRVYVNIDAGVSFVIEPDASGNIYVDSSGCVQYSDYVQDMRDLSDDTFLAHAQDSPHSTNAFRRSHLIRQHKLYPGSLQASGGNTYARDFFAAVGVIPANSGQVGFSGLFDVDLAELQWQPFPRTSFIQEALFGGDTTPIGPLFPGALTRAGVAGRFNDDGDDIYDSFGVGVRSSGQFVLRGDALTSDTVLRIMEASGGTPLGTASHTLEVDGAPYPNLVAIVPSGRKAIYGNFSMATTPDEGVYLLAADTSPTSSSGFVSHFPAEYATPSGYTSGSIWDSAGRLLQPRPEGVYVADKLIFPIADGGSLSVGRSRVTGRKVFGHLVDNAVNSVNSPFQGTFATQDTNCGVPVSPAMNPRNRAFDFLSPGGVDACGRQQGLVAAKCDIDHGVLNDRMGDASFVTLVESFDPDFQFFEDATAGFVSAFGDAVVRVHHNIFEPGVAGFFITQSAVQAARSEADSHSYQIQIFNFSTNSAEIFCEGTVEVLRNDNAFGDTGGTWNFARKKNGRLINVGGNAHINFDGKFFIRLGVTFRDEPPSLKGTRWMFFPGFGFWRYVPTGQVRNLPDQVINVGTSQIVIPTFLPFTDSDVLSPGTITGAGYGPVVYDCEKDVNYLYIQLDEGFVGEKFWFCTMDNSFVITQAVPVEADDAILTNRMAILSI